MPLLDTNTVTLPERSVTGGLRHRWYRCVAISVWMLQNVLHTYRTLGLDKFNWQEKSPVSGAFAEPSNRLELLTPSLPCARPGERWQADATVCRCFALSLGPDLR